MSKQTDDYKRYDDYKTSSSFTPWYNNLLFVSEITAALWAVGSFIKELVKKSRAKRQKSSPKRSAADTIRYISSGFLPGISYSGDNYKNIPLPVAIFVCLISSTILAGFVFVAIVIVTN